MKPMRFKRFSSRGVTVLFAAVIFLSPHSSPAAIRLLRAWQEFYAAADAANGQISDGGVTNLGAGIISSRTYSEHGIVPGAEASTSISQTGLRDNSDFVFYGNSSHSTITNPGPAASYPFAAAYTSQSFEFDVTEQPETVTLTISSLTIFHTSPDSPYFAFGISTRTPYSGVANLPASAPVTNSFTLPIGKYSLTAGIQFQDTSYTTASSSTTFADTISFSNLEIEPGALQSNPLVPSGRAWGFNHVPRRAWVDPPAVNEFSFQMTSNSLFTGIFNFPTGFSNAFEVLSEGQSLGSFTTNQSVNFVELLGHGVSAFRVRNIAPLVDGSDPQAFPIQLDFNTETADFVMLPNPGLDVSRNDAGDFTVRFAGVLEQSTNLVNWADVQGSPSSPLIISSSNAPPRFFLRTRQE